MSCSGRGSRIRRRASSSLWPFGWADPPRGALFMSAMRLLVTGAAGMLGRDVVAAAGEAGHEVAARARADLDITDADAVRAAVQGARPDAVINCAAWTDVDGAEAAEAAATAVNGAGAGHVAAAAAEAGALVVHVSTDYVFDGNGPEPYEEDASAVPALGLRAFQARGRARRRRGRRSCRDRALVVAVRTARPQLRRHHAQARRRARRGRRGRTTRSAAPPTRATWRRRWSRWPSAA